MVRVREKEREGCCIEGYVVGSKKKVEGRSSPEGYGEQAEGEKEGEGNEIGEVQRKAWKETVKVGNLNTPERIPMYT